MVDIIFEATSVSGFVCQNMRYYVTANSYRAEGHVVRISLLAGLIVSAEHAVLRFLSGVNDAQRGHSGSDRANLQESTNRVGFLIAQFDSLAHLPDGKSAFH